MREIETDEKIIKSANADKTIAENKKTVTKSDTKTKKRDKQTVTAITAKTVIITIIKINVKTKRMMSFKSRKNIKLLAVIQIMLKVLFIF